LNRIAISAALALAAAATLGGPTLASPLQNGDFTQPGSADFGQALTASFLPGWTYSSPFAPGDIDEYLQSGTYAFTPSGGHPFLSFGGDTTYGGSITQSFTTVAGTTYTVHYQVGEIQGDDPTQDLQTTLVNGAQTLVQDFVPSDPSAVGDVFDESLTFTALGTSATLSFLDATPVGDGGPSNLALANVSIGGAPEPSTWALMIIGVGGVGAIMRRRAQQRLQTA
jgi:hypothetical protein